MIKNSLLRVCAANLVVCGLAIAEQPAPAVKTNPIRPPNFVVIFTDDLGYQDVGCYGSPEIKTPNLDHMASQGVRFTDFYVASSVCSPSRASLLTGRYLSRHGIQRVLHLKDLHGLPHTETTIAEILKDKGYTTACIGKWHLGHRSEFLPTRHGFDFYFGIPYSNDMAIDPEANLSDKILLQDGATVEKIRAGTEPLGQGRAPLMQGERVIEFPVDQSTLTRRYTDEAIAFIRDNREHPFFLYLAHTMPHTPLFASPEFAGKSKRGLYGDVIEELDAHTGRLLATLNELGLDENTLVVFTSDNGPWLSRKQNGGSAFPLQGGKFSTYEGGFRVPCIMRWPGKIPSGAVCSEVASTIDLLPTLAGLAGAVPPPDRVIDGKDIRPLMFGVENARTPHNVFQYWKQRRQGGAEPAQLEAIRSGPWKLRMEGNQVELFNLQDDIGETKNLAEQMPGRVEQLQQEMSRAANEALEAQ
jgi:arylsulfatase A